MKKCLLPVITFLLVLIIPTIIYAQPGNFPTSLHFTRQGKVTFYSQANGGFETYTGVSIDSIGCLKCHPGTKADGTPIDPATYEPDCFDCHVTPGDQVSDDICLKCHGRQKKEIMVLNLPDVHRDTQNFTCADCHTSGDVHGDGTSYNSLLEQGAIDTDCEDCHTTIPQNAEHQQHSGDIHCATCHIQTVITCYNCHFNSMEEAHLKRATKLLQNFVMIGTRSTDNKIFPATYQSLYYQTDTGQDTSFFTIVPFYGHSVVAQGRVCDDCHNNQNVQDYNNTGELIIGQWDPNQHTVIGLTGVIPIVPDWQTAFKMDFLNYTGQLDTSYTDPTLWVLAESGAADHIQNLGYIQPLTQQQMDWLSTPMAIDEPEPTLPGEFALFQNYPNPFNPSTHIKFQLPHTTSVTVKVFNIVGQEVATLLTNEQMPAGTHSLKFDARNLSSGVYIYQLITPEYTATRKMVLMK